MSPTTRTGRHRATLVVFASLVLGAIVSTGTPASADASRTPGASAPAAAADPNPADPSPADPSPADPSPADPSPADIDHDGVVGGQDLAEVQVDRRIAEQNGDTCARTEPEADDRADVDGDGCVDGDDEALVRAAMAADPEPEQEPAPEPTPAPMPTPGPTTVGDLVVDSDGDQADADYFDGRCRTAAGTCTLRAAITQANAAPGPDRITFAIPGDGPHTIQIETQLPSISDRNGGLEIDGYTQPGAAPNTDPLGFDATIQVEIRGAGEVVTDAVFRITSAHNRIRGLAIYNGGRNVILAGADAHHNELSGNVIGTDAAQRFGIDHGDRSGEYAGSVWLYVGASDNRIGLPTLAGRNVLAGPHGYGVLAEQVGTERNLIRNNLIGITGADEAIPMVRGVDIQWYNRDNVVGGHGPLEGNVISGAYTAGVDLSHTVSGTSVIGNKIGTHLDGVSADASTANEDGIQIKDGARDSLVAANIIGGNRGHGVWSKHNYSLRNRVIDNRIGVGVDGSPLGNGGAGVIVNGIDGEVVGNLIAHNAGAGIHVVDEYPEDIHTNYPRALTEANRFAANRFAANGGPAVVIADTPNAAVQGDVAPPVLTADPDGGVAGTACAGCVVEFAVADADLAHIVPVATVLASTSGTVELDHPAVAGRTVLATATDPESNTSAWSAPAVLNPGPTATPVAPGPFADLVHAVGDSLDLDLTVMAPDGLAFHVMGAPTGIVIDPSGRLQGTLTTAGVFAVEVVVVHGDEILPRSFTWEVTAVGNTAPRFDFLGRRVAEIGVAVAVSVAADVDGDAVTHTATGLPTGLTMTADGTITGVPTEPGSVVSTITATDTGGATTTATMAWSIQALALTCTVDAATASLTWEDGQTGTAYVGLTQDGAFTYLGATTALPITELYGTYEVTIYTANGTDRTTCDGPLAERPVFTCTVDATTASLTWENGRTGTAYLGLTQDGAFTYLGATTATTLPITELYGTYEVTIYTANGTDRTTCDGPLAERPAFTCTVDATTASLTWENGQTGTAYVGQIIDGASTYLGASATGSIAIPNTDGIFEVHYYTDGHVETTCAVSPDPAGSPDPAV